MSPCSSMVEFAELRYGEKNPPNSVGPCLESNSELGEAERQRFGVRKIKKQDVRALAFRVQ